MHGQKFSGTALPPSGNGMFLVGALVVVAALLVQGCVGTVVGAATDVAIEVVKVPFKVTGAVIDVAADDDEDEDD